MGLNMARPKVLVLASQKGGVGKTSLSAHLAVAAETAGFGPVVLFDTDPQGSLGAWYEDREADSPVMAKAAKDGLASVLDRMGEGGIRLVVIDTPPALEAAIKDVLRHADFVVIPTQDGMTDLKAIVRTVQMVREVGVPFAFALNFVKMGTRQATEASMFLSKHGPMAGVIAHRMIYKTAWNTGQTAARAGR